MQSVHPGHYFSIARIDQDEYFYWGSLKEAQAANDNLAVVEPPARLCFSDRGICENVRDLSCSRFHSVAVTGMSC